MRVKVDGVDRLRRTLIAAGATLEDLKAVHDKVGELVERRADPRVPRRSGRLAGTLRHAGQKGAAVIREGRASVPYAGVQEYGWRARGIPAQPHIRPAIADSEDAIRAAYLDGIDDTLAKVKGA